MREIYNIMFEVNTKPFKILSEDFKGVTLKKWKNHFIKGN